MKRTKSMVYRETYESEDLYITTINDGDLYRQMIFPFIDKLKKEVQGGEVRQRKSN